MKYILALSFSLAFLSNAIAAGKPNIVYILCDDLGYGDVKCLGGERSKIATPNIDRLASQGMTFSEAHSSSSVCTPTRYGILTGRYNWRSRLQHGVLARYGTTLIDTNRLTVPAFLKQHGYQAACFGKWHLGWKWPRKGKKMDFAKPITDGPTTRGFDYYFGVDAPNYPPYCFIENDRTVGIPSEPISIGSKRKENFLHLRKGPALPGWNLEAILPTLTDKACDYIAKQSKRGAAFFLYFPMTAPHAPIVPTKEWQGKSELHSLYADFVMETDAMVGQVLAALEQCGIASNTLVIFTSDNGCSPALANVVQLEKDGHFPSEFRRGYKADIWDGGHRIPFIARWPGKIKAGSRSDQLICLTDLMATCAEILGVKLPNNAGEDSVSILPALVGVDKAPLREAVVHHSIWGNFAIRQGQWKLELCNDSGGWGKGSVQDAPGQLYDVSKDVGERTNEYNQHPEIVSRLTKLLEKYVAYGRSTPGPAQKNDKAVDIWKKNAPKVEETE